MVRHAAPLSFVQIKGAGAASAGAAQHRFQEQGAGLLQELFLALGKVAKVEELSTEWELEAVTWTCVMAWLSRGYCLGQGPMVSWNMWGVHQNRILYPGGAEVWGSRNTCLAKSAGPAKGEGCKGQLHSSLMTATGCSVPL